ncbi:MAG: HAD family hydrolase [Clostridia bacterium]|nr:HAD family hydrolase [Clostridia bacterium]
MNLMKKLVICDFDGTIANRQSELSMFTVATVREFIERGGKFAFCSGRSLPSLINVTKEYALNCYYMVGHAAKILNSTFTLLQKNDMPVVTALPLIKGLDDKNCEIIVFADDIPYAQRRSSYTEGYERKTSPVTYIDKPFLKFLPENCARIQKILVIGDEDRIKNLTDWVNDGRLGDSLEAGNSHPFFLEIVHKNSSKGEGLAWLCNYLGIDNADSVAFGDSSIDVSMLKRAGIGIAVKNATAECKAAADVILDRTNDEDGVAHWICENLLEAK